MVNGYREWGCCNDFRKIQCKKETETFATEKQSSELYSLCKPLCLFQVTFKWLNISILQPLSTKTPWSSF